MRKVFLTSAAVMALGMAAGMTGCSSSPSAASTAAARKTAFCGGNIKIDKASGNVDSAAGFLTVLKDHKSALSAMEKNLPSGTLGTEAREEIAAAQAAVASGNANDLNNAPSSSGGDIDTYCGVDGNGDPLPAYFATGKGSSFCTTFIPIYDAVGNATSASGVLAALEANKTQITELATEVSGLPSSIKGKASATVSKAQTAIAENSAASLKGNGNGPAAAVALYCGQNQ
ncbi:MAG TPA: hypothetical protein VK215_02125 [Acidimicrobiales bacterium]|nr:hypothetical protein [Acidimicrobiales bacterium]HLN41218.1 hypothetical protein [Acidimicrobiales bacterium]